MSSTCDKLMDGIQAVEHGARQYARMRGLRMKWYKLAYESGPYRRGL